LRLLPSLDPEDPGYRRLRYIRYADDHLLGFAGPKSEAEKIKARLLTRLLADTCEICQHSGQVEVHHIRKLKDLGAPGPLQPQWAKAMAKRRRKTLVVCAACHGLIHARQPAPSLTQ